MRLPYHFPLFKKFTIKIAYIINEYHKAANSSSAGQKFPLLIESKGAFSYSKTLLSVSILSHVNPVHTLLPISLRLL
jgi:hypothetical protein